MFSATWSSLSTETKRILKPKLQIYTKPRHDLCTLLAAVFLGLNVNYGEHT